MLNKGMIGARGPLKGRAYDIDDLFENNGVKVEDFVINDIEAITNAYTRSMASQVGMVRTFGSLDIEDEVVKIRNEYERLKSKNPEQAAKLQSSMEADERDLLALRDRILGTYELPDDYSSAISRTTRIVKQLNYMRFLGGMTISAIPDMGRAIMVHGLSRTMRGAIAPMVTNRQAMRAAMKEVPEAGTALDIVLNTRARAMADLDEYVDAGDRDRS